MAFLRFSRDKRGYEHFSLIQPTNRRGKARPRLLYFYRTPPNVRVGREPFDDTVRRALEAQNPGVGFDWKQILATPIPSADAEFWRERRRAERAARHAAVENESAEAPEASEAIEGADPETSLSEGAVAAVEPASTVTVPPPPTPAPPDTSRRRRRRRGRPGQSVQSGATQSRVTSSEPQEGSPDAVDPLKPVGE